LALKFYKLLTVAGLLLAASACTINPLKKYAGTFCTNLLTGDECFYLHEDGTGLIDDERTGQSVKIYWELMDDNKILYTADGTPNGSTITFSEDASEFVGRGSVFQIPVPLTYKKQEEAAHNE
jgi:hypothetical protein